MSISAFAPATVDPRHELPPGQRAVQGLPRFGRRPQQGPPVIPPAPSIRISGPLDAPIVLDVAALDELPQVRRVADFHCVSGWTATEVVWDGVSFDMVYRRFVRPRLIGRRQVTHLVLCGLDGYRVVVRSDDLLGGDVLLATRLHGAPLSRGHGAPVRVVSPHQYGFVSVKHLCAIELHTSRPRHPYPMALVTRGHLRGRVWREERHAWFPAWVVRPVYRLLVRLIAAVDERRREARSGRPEPGGYNL